VRPESLVLLILHEAAPSDLLYHAHDLRCISMRDHDDIPNFHQLIVKCVELFVPHEVFDQVPLIGRANLPQKMV
jgi:hypothetical protein